MPRTAPAPNIPAIPGMNPGAFVMGGGGSGGGGSGKGGGGKGGKHGGNGQDGGDDASGGGRGANGCGTGTNGGCSNCSPSTAAGHPVDVVTGRVFTEPQLDLQVNGPLPFVFLRQYNSAANKMDFGLGYAWGHSLGWRILERRRDVEVWTSEARKIEMAVPEGSTPSYSRGGWELMRRGAHLVLDVGAETTRWFEPVPGEPKRWRLVRIEDLAGNRIELVWEPRVLRLTDSGGRAFTLPLDARGRITSIVLDAGPHGEARELARYEYDESGNLTRFSDAGGATWKYEYDGAHRLVREVHPSGLSFHFVYDSAGRCIETWGAYPDTDPALDPEAVPVLADGRTRAKGIHHAKLEYGSDGYVEVTNSYRVDRFFGNDLGMLDKAVTGGSVSTWTYDETGNPTSHTDAEGNVTKYEWDRRGRLLRATDPLGRTTEIERDAAGRVIAHIDPAGHTWRYERDGRGLVTAMTTPLGARFEVVRDERGLVREERLPTGAVITYDWDAQGNLVRIGLPEGGEWRYEYDALGRKVRATDPLGRSSLVWLDARGLATAARDPAGGITRYEWDPEGRLLALTDPDGSLYRFTWGGLHRIATLTYPNGDTFRQSFDREGQIVVLRAPNGERWRRWYDPQGRPAREEAPDGRVTTFHHDRLGRLVRRVDGAGEITTYTYDAASQCIAAEYADDTVEKFEYDDRGLVVALESPAYRIEAMYDPDRNLVSETQTVAGRSVTIEYAYDLLGECTRYATSVGHVAVFERSPRGNVNAIVLDDALRIDVARNVHGRVQSWSIGTGLTVEQAHDAVDRVVATRLWHASGAAAELAFVYTPAGHLVQRTVAVGTGRPTQEVFSYDPKGRLVLSARDGRSRSFSYEPNDDLFETTPGAPRRAYGPGSRLRSIGDVAYEWDGASRLRARTRRTDSGEERTSFEWDGRGCLRSARTPDRTIEVVHDAGGRRLYKRVVFADGTVLSESRFVWDRHRLVHEIRTDASGREQVLTFFVEGDVAPVPRLVRERDAWRWIVAHNNGQPVLLASMDGALEEVAIDAWGETLGSTPPTLPFRFSGQWFDEETNLCENHFRYYEPSAGRYTAPDPMGMFGGWNPFAYCLNPVGWADPLGLMLMRLTTTAPGVSTTDPAPMPYSYGDPPEYQPAPNEWRNYPRQSMGGPAGDCEQRIMAHLDPTGTGNPALRGHEVNMHCLGEPGTNMGPLEPCPSCRERLRAFAHRNRCTVNYTMETKPGERRPGLQFLPDGTIGRL